MTLEEAIKHCEEVAKEKCDACGAEHKQLAEWLRELKWRRNAMNWMAQNVGDIFDMKNGGLKMAKGKIKLLWERMELDVKPLLDEQVYNELMDLLDEAMIEAYKKGKRRADNGRDKY